MPFLYFPIISLWLNNKYHIYIFHCKSMATLSCHTNQSFWAIAMRLIQRIFLQNFSPMFYMVSKEMMFKDTIPLFAFWLPWQQSKSGLGSKIFCLVEDHSRNISIKVLSKYLRWRTINAIFVFSHYKSMATLSYHTNQSNSNEKHICRG